MANTKRQKITPEEKAVLDAIKESLRHPTIVTDPKQIKKAMNTRRGSVGRFFSVYFDGYLVHQGRLEAHERTAEREHIEEQKAEAAEDAVRKFRDQSDEYQSGKKALLGGKKGRAARQRKFDPVEACRFFDEKRAANPRLSKSRVYEIVAEAFGAKPEAIRKAIEKVKAKEK